MEVRRTDEADAMTKTNWAYEGIKCRCIKSDEWVVFEPADEGHEGDDRHPEYGEICKVLYVYARRSGEIALKLEGYETNDYRPVWFEPI